MGNIFSTIMQMFQGAGNSGSSPFAQGADAKFLGTNTNSGPLQSGMMQQQPQQPSMMQQIMQQGMQGGGAKGHNTQMVKSMGDRFAQAQDMSQPMQSGFQDVSGGAMPQQQQQRSPMDLMAMMQQMQQMGRR